MGTGDAAGTAKEGRIGQVTADIARCWAFARVNLPGISEQDFWRLTPREFRLLQEEHEDQQRRIDRRFAALQATICNASGGYDRIHTVSDFIYAPSPDGPDLDAAFGILAHFKQT
jgi:hypothetical protein